MGQPLGAVGMESSWLWRSLGLTARRGGARSLLAAGQAEHSHGLHRPHSLRAGASAAPQLPPAASERLSRAPTPPNFPPGAAWHPQTPPQHPTSPPSTL